MVTNKITKKDTPSTKANIRSRPIWVFNSSDIFQVALRVRNPWFVDSIDGLFSHPKIQPDVFFTEDVWRLLQKKLLLLKFT